MNIKYFLGFVRHLELIVKELLYISSWNFNKQNILNKVKEATQTAVVMDEGLRSYMLKVYNYMATGILLTGIIASLNI